MNLQRFMILPRSLSFTSGAHIDLEVLWERPFIEELSGSRAGAIAIEGNQTDSVFDGELVIHREVSEFDQINGMINDRGLVSRE